MDNGNTLLGSLRVLDLTNHNGYLCGKILADMGADVIKIENPNKNKYPDINLDVTNRGKDLNWFAYNLNKKCITLNIETFEGRKIFDRLLRKADFVIESFSPGYLDTLGFSYSYLSEINPRLILISITPFGQTGPFKDFKASDIEVMAMSGLMYITGNPDEAPLRISFPQAFLLASAHGAAASMIAHYHREITGEGQHIDISAQAVVMWEISNAIPLFELNQIVLKRAGSYLTGRSNGTKQRLLWKCQDGYVTFYILGGSFGIKTNKAMVKWMEENGSAPEFLVNFDWTQFDMTSVTQELQDRIEEPIVDFFLRFNKTELYSEAQKRGIMLYPVCTSKDIIENEQLKARDFWINMKHPTLPVSFVYPGPFAKLSETPLILPKRAPLFGEHNFEVYESELGISKLDLVDLQQTGVI